MRFNDYRVPCFLLFASCFPLTIKTAQTEIRLCLPREKMNKYLGWARGLLQNQLPDYPHFPFSRPNHAASAPGLKMKNLFTVVIAGSQYLLHPQKLV